MPQPVRFPHARGGLQDTADREGSAAPAGGACNPALGTLRVLSDPTRRVRHWLADTPGKVGESRLTAIAVQTVGRPDPARKHGPDAKNRRMWSTGGRRAV